MAKLWLNLLNNHTQIKHFKHFCLQNPPNTLKITKMAQEFRKTLMQNSELQQVAEIIVHYSTTVQAGETVFMRGLSPLAEPLVQALYQAVLQVGGLPIPYIHMSLEDKHALVASDDLALLAEPNPVIVQMYEQADVIIGIHAAEDLHALSKFSPEKQAARAQANAIPIKIQKERMAQGKLRRCTTLIPTPAYATAAGMSLEQFTAFWQHACRIHQPDPIQAWQDLYAYQQKLVQYFNGRNHIEIRGENIDLQLSITDRSFINSAGKANFPDGEVFTSPVEDSANGWIRFNRPTYFNGVEVNGLELRFIAGELVTSRAATNEKYFKQILTTDDGVYRLGELGIGTNTDIDQFTSAILFDEKMAGTIHFALGQGFPQAGGQNKSAIHWDMVHDMRDGTEIWLDRELIYQNGNFLIE